VFLVGAVVAYFTWRRQIRAAVVTGATAVVVSLPWWTYNLALTGSLMPTSSRAEHAWALSAFRVKAMVQAVSTGVMPWTCASRFDTFGLTLLRFACVALVIAVCLRLARTSAGTPTSVTNGRVGSFGRLMASAVGLLTRIR
jgi:hypothetical protein